MKQHANLSEVKSRQSGSWWAVPQKSLPPSWRDC